MTRPTDTLDALREPARAALMHGLYASAAVLASSACGGPLFIERLSLSDVRTEILVLEGEAGAVAYAYEPGELRFWAPELERPEEREIFVIGDRSRLLPPGKLALAPDGDPLASEDDEVFVFDRERGAWSGVGVDRVSHLRLARGRCLYLSGGEGSELVPTERCDDVPLELVLPVATAATPVAPAPFALHCPMTWRAVEGRCVGPEPPAPVTCARGELQRRGEIGCAPLGAACPTGDWPTVAMGVEVRWVHASGGLDPLGRPAFASIDAASIEAPPGVQLVLSRGAHVAPRDRVPETISIVGACARDTRVSIPLVRGEVSLSQLTLVGATVVESAARLVLRSVAIEDRGPSALGVVDAADVHFVGAGPALEVQRGGSARLSRASLELSGAAPFGLVAMGGALEADDVLVRATSGVVATSSAGGALALRGLVAHGGTIEVRGGASAELTDVSVRGANDGGDDLVVEAAQLRGARIDVVRSSSVALLATRGARVSLTDLSIAGPRSGDAVHAASSSSVTIQRASIVQSVVGGVKARGAAAATFRALVIVGLDGGGVGLTAERGAELTLEGARFSGQLAHAVLARAAIVRVSDLVTTAIGAYGVVADFGGTLSLTRVEIDVGAVAQVRAHGAILRAQDVRTRARGPVPSIAFLANSRVDLERIFVDVTQTASAALFATRDVEGELRDLTVDRSASSSEPALRMGSADECEIVGVEPNPSAAKLHLRRMAVTGLRANVVHLAGAGLSVDIEDLSVVGEPLEGRDDPIVTAHRCATLVLERVSVPDFTSVALNIHDIGTRVVLTDLQLRGSAPMMACGGARAWLRRASVVTRREVTGDRLIDLTVDCALVATDLTLDHALPVGIRVDRGATLDLTRFDLTGARDAAIDVPPQPIGVSATLRQGVIRASPAGLSAPSDALVDLEDLRFIDVDVPLRRP